MINNAKSQQEAIKLHLLKYKQITSIEAISNYGITRLSHYIYVLRKEGWTIDNQHKHVKNRFKNTSNYVNYKLVKTIKNK